jgi:hypothetical protein
MTDEQAPVEEVNTPVEETVAAPVEETTPEAPQEPTEEKPEAPVETPSVDRSAFNCPVCKGEGLVVDNFEEGNFVRCLNCQGTGKV